MDGDKAVLNGLKASLSISLWELERKTAELAKRVLRPHHPGGRRLPAELAPSSAPSSAPVSRLASAKVVQRTTPSGTPSSDRTHVTQVDGFGKPRTPDLTAKPRTPCSVETALPNLDTPTAFRYPDNGNGNAHLRDPPFQVFAGGSLRVQSPAIAGTPPRKISAEEDQNDVLSPSFSPLKVKVTTSSVLPTRDAVRPAPVRVVPPQRATSPFVSPWCVQPLGSK
jgi:hypothetical protein